MRWGITRRSTLYALSAAGTAAIAGCSALEESNEPGQDDGTAPENGDSSDSEELEAIESDVAYQGSPGRLLNVGDGLLVAWRDEQEELEGLSYRGEILDGFHNVHAPFVPVDGGVAYRVNEVVNENSNGVKQFEWVLRSGGNELYRWLPNNESRLNDIQLEGATDGKPLWVNKREDPHVLMHGDEPLSTEYDGYGDVTTIGGEIAYVGMEDKDGNMVSDAVVLGGEVIENLDGSSTLLRDVGGEVCLYRATSEGYVLELNGQEFGGQYTTRENSGFEYVFDLGGRLGFITDVPEDQREDPEEDEQVLWYDGNEIARHETIGASTARGIRGVELIDGTITYNAIDEDGRKIIQESGNVLADPEHSPSEIQGFNDKPLYSIETENGQALVHGQAQTDTYETISHPTAVDDTVYFLATEGSEERIYQI